MQQHFFGLGNFLLLSLEIQFCFLQIDLGGLDLNGILELVIAGGLLFSLFQICDLGLVIFDGGDQLLFFQSLLVQRKLELLHIIGEQILTLGHIVAFLNENLGNGLVAVFLNFRHVFGNHHPREPVAGSDSTDGTQICHGLHIDCCF